MKRTLIHLAIALTLALTTTTAMAQSKSTRTKSRAKTTAVRKMTTPRTTATTPRIVGKHMMSLQWLSWKNFGSCTIGAPNAAGEYPISGSQKGGDEAGNVNDYVTIDGVITYTDPYRLKFRGKVVTKVYHINGGQPVVREGELDFHRKDNRNYWRMQQMINPADSCYDYVDIYFK